MKELACDTCQWHDKECDSPAYENRKGRVVGEDWCELYIPKDDGGSRE